MDEKDVRKVFIIGNGFDLSLGYPTRFKDFIDFCKNWDAFYRRTDDEKYATDTHESNINEMKLSYDKNGKQVNHWNKTELSLLKIYCDTCDKQDLNTLNALIRDNGLIKYLINKNSVIEYDRWSDFENYLLEICEMIEEYERQLIAYSKDRASGASFKCNIEFYDFMEYVFIENNFYSHENVDKYIVETAVRIDKLKFIQMLSEQLLDFSKAFNIYLKCFVHKIQPPQWQYNFSQDNTFVIDFNYTNVCEKIFNGAKINYVHGYLHDDNIIIGINSESLSEDYDPLRKNFLRLNMKVGTRQTRQTDLLGKYENIDDALAQCYRHDIRILTYVIVIGHSLSRVDWDILRNFFNADNLYTRIAFCHYRSYYNQLLNLYKMLQREGISNYDVDRKIEKGYYSFIKFNNLIDLMKEIDDKFFNLSECKHIDLSPEEEAVMREIIKNQASYIGTSRFITDIAGFSVDETSDFLEKLSKKGYIEIAPVRKTLNVPGDLYHIIKVLKF